MFSIGFWETIIILIAIIIFVKPEDIPNFVRKIGKIIGELRTLYEEFIDNFVKIDNNRIKHPQDAHIPEEYKEKKLIRKKRGRKL